MQFIAENNKLIVIGKNMGDKRKIVMMPLKSFVCISEIFLNSKTKHEREGEMNRKQPKLKV